MFLLLWNIGLIWVKLILLSGGPVRMPGLMNWMVILLLRICAGGLGPLQSALWTATRQVRQPWPAVVAIEARMYVCVCVCVCVYIGPRYALQTGPGLVSSDQTWPQWKSRHLRWRDDSSILCVCLCVCPPWKGRSILHRGSIGKHFGMVTMKQPAMEMTLFVSPFLSCLEEIKVSRLLRGLFLFLSFGGCMVSCLTGPWHDNEGVCVYSKDRMQVNKMK